MTDRLYSFASGWSSWLLDNAPVWNDAQVLRLVRHLGDTGRKSIRVVFFGVFKAGKSTLINSLLGDDPLAVGVLSTTGVPASIGYGKKWAARVHYSTNTGSTASKALRSPEDARSFMRIGRDNRLPPEATRIESVEIELDHPLLRNGVVLVDTPGLDDGSDQSRELEAMTLAELARADIAVCVLNAMQRLKKSEKDVILRAQSLLGGNVVFVLNWLQSLTRANRNTVIEDVRRNLTAGNSLVGKPRIFLADSEQHLEDAQGRQTDVGFLELQEWIASDMDQSLLERVKANARASVALSFVEVMQRDLIESINEAENKAKKELESQERSRAEWHENNIEPVTFLADLIRQRKQTLLNELRDLFASIVKQYMQPALNDSPVTYDGLYLKRLVAEDVRDLLAAAALTLKDEPDFSSVENWAGSKATAHASGNMWIGGAAAGAFFGPLGAMVGAAAGYAYDRVTAKPAPTDPWQDARESLRGYLLDVLLSRCNAFYDRVAHSLEQIAAERRAQYAVGDSNGVDGRAGQLRTFSKALDPLGVGLKTFTSVQ